MVVCLINAAMDDATKKLLMNGVVAFYVTTVICYAFFLRKVRKVSVSEEHMRGIYRSLILVTAAIALSFVSFGVVNVVLSILQINMDELNRTWLTGTFLNLSTAANFFIYYFNSKQYRNLFDHYLFINTLKKALKAKETSAVTVVGKNERPTKSSRY
ncbi:unnamed protein product [Cylicocyclus nassatus]|uniref:G-protein coupled receptors family 1 profile domain-containing protein n=1 Tax=Cylicocyclus nassatus TaxID=53992 RepID=A0AA36M7L9_CYLNA|nr:unnamed protein product [Cylicocyclus nassatus]